MIFLLILISCVVTLSVDWYIYRRVIRYHNAGRIWKIGYIVYALVVDLMVVTALAAYNTVLDWQSTASMRAILWIIGLFFLNAVPKSVYAVVSLGDYLRRKRTGRVSHLFGYLRTLLAVVCLLWMGYGLTYGRSVIRVERVELTFDNLPATFDGTRVAVFADTHLGNMVRSEKFLERMRDTINMLGADIVINAGNIINVHERELYPRALEILGGIRGRYGVFSVIGNHDLGIYISDTVKNPPQESLDLLMEKQQALGWHILRDRSMPVTNGQDTIYITGLEYPAELIHNSHAQLEYRVDVMPAYGGVPEGAFDLTITHAPQLWDDILRAGVGNLSVAGHVHSMQIKFTVGKWSWSPARLLYPRWSGLYEQDGRYLYINDGTGYVMFPMRLGTKPEITLFVLRSGQKGGEL